MEFQHSSPSGEPQAPIGSTSSSEPRTPSVADRWFSERFDTLLPKIQERWPDVAKQTLEATRGSLDEVVRVISQQSSNQANQSIREQLEEILNVATDRTRDLAENLEPLEHQLEELLDELNNTLRPRLERPVRKKPLLAVGLAAGIGIVLGLLLAGGRRS